MTTTATERRIYVACLACYNAGRMVGRWIDAEQDAGAIEAERAAMMDPVTGEHDPCCLPHEETAIHDFEGFEGIRLGESESLADVAKLAELLEEHGAAFGAWYDNETRDLADDLGEEFQEQFRGEWRSLEEYAEDWLEQTGGLADVPESLRYYFDFAAFGRDLETNGDVWTVDGGAGVYVFENS